MVSKFFSHYFFVLSNWILNVWCIFNVNKTNTVCCFRTFKANDMYFYYENFVETRIDFAIKKLSLPLNLIGFVHFPFNFAKFLNMELFLDT